MWLAAPPIWRSEYAVAVNYFVSCHSELREVCLADCWVNWGTGCVGKGPKGGGQVGVCSEVLFPSALTLNFLLQLLGCSSWLETVNNADLLDYSSNQRYQVSSDLKQDFESQIKVPAVKCQCVIHGFWVEFVVLINISFLYGMEIHPFNSECLLCGRHHSRHGATVGKVDTAPAFL